VAWTPKIYDKLPPLVICHLLQMSMILTSAVVAVSRMFDVMRFVS